MQAMKHILSVLLAAMILPLAVMASGSGNGYDDLMRKAMDMPSADIIQMATKAESARQQDKALVYYMVVINRAGQPRGSADVSLPVLASLRSGDIYYWRGNYAKALSLYVQALKLTEKSEEKPHVVEIYKSMGNVYCMYEDYEKAVQCYRYGLKLSSRYTDDESKYRTLLNLSYSYHLMGRTVDSRQSYNASQNTPHIKTPEFVFFDRFYLSAVLQSENNHREALSVLKPLSAYAHRNGLPPSYECSVYEGMYRSYQALGNADSTLFYLNRCYEFARQTGTLSMFTETMKEISRIYEKRGLREKAENYMARYMRAVDSTFNRREFSIAKNAQFTYEMDRIDRKIVRLNAEMESNRQVIRLQRILLITIIAVILVVCGLTLIVRRQKFHLRQSYRNLFTMNRKLQQMHSHMVETNAAAGPATPVASPVRPGQKYKSSNLSDDQRNALVQKISHIMEHTTEFADENFSLDTLATLTGSNSKYVSQVINDCYGKNFSNYVSEYRVRMACSRLADTLHYGKYTIRGIAASVGYRSNTTFVNVFRKITGMTPSAYRSIAMEESQKTGEGAE